MFHWNTTRPTCAEVPHVLQQSPDRCLCVLPFVLERLHMTYNQAGSDTSRLFGTAHDWSALACYKVLFIDKHIWIRVLQCSSSSSACSCSLLGGRLCFYFLITTFVKRVLSPFKHIICHFQYMPPVSSHFTQVDRQFILNMAMNMFEKWENLFDTRYWSAPIWRCSYL